jgi:hypothetical protein
MRTISGAIVLVASALFWVGDGLARSGTRDVGIFISLAVGTIGVSLIIAGLVTDWNRPNKHGPEQ